MARFIQSIFSRIGLLSAVQKLGISLLVTILVFLAIPGNLTSRPNFMISWDTFSFMMILLSWIGFFTIQSQQIREKCKKQDETRSIIFVLIVVATIASLSEVFQLLKDKSLRTAQDEINYMKLALGIAGLLFAGILIHTIFALRYAHLYYGNDKSDPRTHAGGLIFPGDKNPDYLDFAYYSLVLGMTFQVSDVQITAKTIRRLSLLHGLISFLFNTFFVALTVNLIAGFNKS